MAKYNRTHMKSETKTYKAWLGMKQRCLNSNTIGFKNWGGRGIIICDRWKDSFENFLFDMGECPSNFSLDRIDNNGNYEPGNCRWATKKEQARNCRKCRYLEYNGERKTLTEWAETIGITVVALSRRLKRCLSTEDLLKKKKTYRKKKGLKNPIKDMSCIYQNGGWYAI